MTQILIFVFILFCNIFAGNAITFEGFDGAGPRGEDTSRGRSPRCAEGPIGCDCAGSTNGANLISTHFKSHYHRLAKYYENCTVITGNLEITHISPKEIYEVDKQYERRENTSIFRRKPFWFLQNIQEISGYLLIFYVDTETLSLPNLKIIRGRHLFDGNGLKVGRNNIRYLKMPRLRSVLKGGITIQASAHKPPCYLLNSVDFTHLKGDPKANITITGREESNCTKDDSVCHFACNDHCYGPEKKDCQELYRVDCPSGCDSCFTDRAGKKHCCHSECAAGCTGLGPDHCVTCRNFLQDGQCVPECNGLEKYDKEQSKIVQRDSNDIRYFYESYCVKECPDKTLIEGKYCVVACKDGHYRDVDVDRRRCIPCNGPCPKVCYLNDSLTIDTLKTLVNCSEIDGNLELLNHLFEDSAFYPHLLNNLKSIRIVTGYVMIDGGGMEHRNKPTNLKFLENLKIIEGRNIYVRYALVVQGLTNLTELGLRKLQKISEGHVAFLNNSQLCFGEKVDWKMIGVDKAVYKNNAPVELCATKDYYCDKTCDPDKGCWGKGPFQCLECKHFVKEEECVNSCAEEDGLYQVGENQCMRCDRECRTCHGPTAYDCKSCKNFRHEDIDYARYHCVETCPNSTYTHLNDCLPCHDNCYEHGCNGGDARLGSGCKKCRYGVNTGNEIQCLAGANVKNACQNWIGYYPDLPSLMDIEDGECRKCRKECKQCTSWGTCTECSKYNLVPFNETGRLVTCVSSCGEGNREIRPQIGKNLGVCQQCHPLCDTTKTCSGTSEFDCERCRFAGINKLTGFECVSTCPQSHPFLYENFCHEYDVATEERNKKIMIAGIIISALLLFGCLIFYLISRCTRYRKKFEQEQQLHLPEIPEYDKSALTRRPNMNRLTVISRSQLGCDKKKILGTGAFGTVYAGVYKVKDAKGKEIQIPVAIKEIKMDSCASWSTEAEMIEEATIMASLDHEHLLRLVGICFVDGVKLITVLRPMGCLRDFLFTNAKYLGARDLILYCYQISSAMEYLTRHKIVHCDLAARNVLMRKNNHIEVTDFGLAKMLEGSNSAVAGAKVPFKWVPLECLVPRGEFSEASDVWAFGVTCWEIITYGATPYKEEHIQRGDDMYRFLKDGHRLKQPSNCGVQLHGTLISCWSENPASRPHFSDLKETFLKYCKIPTEYIQDRHITQRMDSFVGSEEQQRQQIQRLLSLTDSAMGGDEEIYTDQNGVQIVFNPMNLDSPRPMPISKKRHSSSASSRYKADPLRSYQSNTIDTRLTEVDTDEENYLVPNSAEIIKLDPNGCKYTKVNVPVNANNSPKAHESSQKHHYQNDGVGEITTEYLNVDETTTEEEEAFPFNEIKPSRNSSKNGSEASIPVGINAPGNAYINQAESVV